MSHVAVIDIGKTNAKLALVDTATLAEVAVVTRPNAVRHGPPWPHFDTEGHWEFLLDGLARFHAQHGVEAISVTTHGACAVLIGEDGGLAAPVLDYEHPGPEAVAAEYDAIRPPFSETGSPRLGMGLNLGAQLFWQFRSDPGLLERTRHVVTYPGFWTCRLSGAASCEVTSLGCHTDLWNPHERRLSSLVESLGIAGKIAPIRAPGEVLGPVLPDIAERTGLDRETPVLCGIHDSNASLLPHLLAEAAPFSVVSTGTWVIAMAIGGRAVTLDPGLDTLINVNAFGDPVPSARFMGGREFDLAMGGPCPEPGDAEIRAVLEAGAMLLPAVVPETGPYQGMEARWIGEPAAGTAERAAAVGFYLALVAARCLDLIGREGPVLVEGPFARNRCFLAMLEAATGAPVRAMGGTTGTSQGAALLAGGETRAAAGQEAVAPGRWAVDMARYAADWRKAL